MITYVQAVDEFATIVAENPTYIYVMPDGAGCMYVHGLIEDDTLTPGCIIGVWLHRFHGVPLKTLQKYEGESALTLINELVTQNLMVGVEPDVVRLAVHLQQKQDSGRSWSEALKLAKRGVFS
jgi:hypothetical protein